MVQEDQERFSNIISNGGTGGKFSKKAKQKKIPQRGLGVAQLEKIRLEEQQQQQKKDSSTSAFLSLPHQSSSISFPPLFPSSSSSLFRSPPSSNFDPFLPSPPSSPIPRTTIYGNHQPECGNDNGGSGYFPYTRNPFELDREVPKLDPMSNQTWSWNIQRKHQPSSIMNVSDSSSSGVKFQIEPPSNQSYSSNFTAPPLWPVEEKMVGMKRPWPFSLEKPSDSSFNYKLPQLLPPICRLDESSSCLNGDIQNFDQGNLVFREGSSNSSAINVGWRGSSSERNSRKSTKEIGSLDGKFLTLGFPSSSSSSSSSEAKQPFMYPAPDQIEFPEFNLLPSFPVYNEDMFFGSSGIVQQQSPVYSLFPLKGKHTDRLTSKSSKRKSEGGEDVDLNLTLQVGRR